MESIQFSFPISGGRIQAVVSYIPRTWWDRLRRQYRLNYALSFCSPEDLRDNYNEEKGFKIARERLNAFLSGRRSLQNRGYAGTLTFGYQPNVFQIRTMLFDAAVDIAPLDIWYKREDKLRAEARLDYWRFLAIRKDQNTGKVKGLAETRQQIEKHIRHFGVLGMRQVMSLHRRLPHPPTFLQSLHIIESLVERGYEATEQAMFPPPVAQMDEKVT